MTATLPGWAVVGAEVYGARSGPVLTIASIGKAYIILSDGSKWRRADLYPVGTPPANKRYGVGPCRLDSKESVDHWRVVGIARDLHRAVYQWTQNSRDETATEALRAAIERLAPHLGLTVTRQATND